MQNGMALLTPSPITAMETLVVQFQQQVHMSMAVAHIQSWTTPVYWLKLVTHLMAGTPMPPEQVELHTQLQPHTAPPQT